MIRGFVPDNGRLRVADDPLRQLDDVLWLDLVNPTDAEEATLEGRLAIDIPTREETSCTCPNCVGRSAIRSRSSRWCSRRFVPYWYFKRRGWL
jgi:Mg2+ and Co2+ transporter CorA